MDITNSFHIRILSDICKKLNIHLVIYEVVFIGKGYGVSFDDNVILGKKIVDLKHCSYFKKEVNMNRSTLSPRKISFAYWGYISSINGYRVNMTDIDHQNVHFKESYTLICSKTDHSDKLSTDHNSSYPIYHTKRRFKVQEYVFNETEALESTATRVAEFVLEELEKSMTQKETLVTDLQIKIGLSDGRVNKYEKELVDIETENTIYCTLQNSLTKTIMQMHNIKLHTKHILERCKRDTINQDIKRVCEATNVIQDMLTEEKKQIDQKITESMDRVNFCKLARQITFDSSMVLRNGLDKVLGKEIKDTVPSSRVPGGFIAGIFRNPLSESLPNSLANSRSSYRSNSPGLGNSPNSDDRSWRNFDSWNNGNDTYGKYNKWRKGYKIMIHGIVKPTINT